MSKAPWYKPWARRKDPEQRNDGWQSAIMGYGGRRDKRTSLDFVAHVVTDDEARELWRGNDIATKAIEVIPEEMWRRGYQLSIDGDKVLAERIQAVAEEKGVDRAFHRAEEFVRAYGGAGIFPEINDGASDLREPLREHSIMRIGEISVYEPRELQVAQYDRRGNPEIYRLQPINGHGGQATEIHVSRLIILKGRRVSNDENMGTRPGWGDSVLTAMHEAMRDFGLAWNAVGALIGDFSQAVIQMEGLAAIFALDKDDVFYKRMQALEASRSALRAILLDSKESFRREPTPVTGLAELLVQFMHRLASAADLPVTRLFGTSPAGLNATGESDRAFLYDRTAAAQKKRKPDLERMIKLLMLAKDGPTRGIEPDVWSVEWRSLWEPTESEIADTRLKQAQTDQIYVMMTILDADEVRRSRFGGDTYSYETQVDDKARAFLQPAPAIGAQEPEGGDEK